MLETLKEKVRILHEIGGIPYTFLAKVLGLNSDYFCTHYGTNANAKDKVKGTGQGLEVHIETLDYLMDKLIREYNKTRDLSNGNKNNA